MVGRRGGSTNEVMLGCSLSLTHDGGCEYYALTRAADPITFGPMCMHSKRGTLQRSGTPRNKRPQLPPFNGHGDSARVPARRDSRAPLLSSHNPRATDFSTFAA